ncbi:MAG TPA: 3-oxoadipate enol-lactonase [Roseiarcus sp.]|nr:3-oxoadipate enol-lactonase [Roseiarcus sp.]
MGFARVNGGVVHYREEGPRDAPAIALINALGTDFRIWDEVAAILARDFRIIRYDKRGHGLSDSGPDRYDMADYAADLKGLLERLGVTRATIVGLSIGGLIAQELYRRRADLFEALVLSDTAAKIGTDQSWEARIAEVERGGIEAIADAILERWFTPGFRANRADDLAGWRCMLTRTPKQGYLAACGALKQADLRPYTGAIKTPTLCVVGDQDGSTPVDLVRETAALIPGARLEIVTGAGHIPSIERPDVFAELVAAHVESARNGP